MTKSAVFVARSDCDGLGVIAALTDRCARCGGSGSVPSTRDLMADLRASLTTHRQPAVLPEPDLCEVCDKPIPEGETNDCAMLGLVHPGCNTYANGCRDPLCDPAWEEN